MAGEVISDLILIEWYQYREIRLLSTLSIQYLINEKPFKPSRKTKEENQKNCW